MSAVPTPRLDRDVMRALEVRAMEWADLARYLGVDKEPLYGALQRLTRSWQIECRGKLYSLRLPHVIARLEQPEEVPEPRKLRFGYGLGGAQRMILALLSDREPMTVEELKPLTPTDAGTLRRGLAAMEHKGLVTCRLSGPLVRGKAVLRWTLTDMGRRVPAC